MRYLFEFFLEIIFLLFDLITSILQVFTSQKTTTDGLKQTVIIIPGFFTGDLFFFKLKRFFERQGFCVVIANNNLHIHDIKTRTKELKSFIDQHKINDPIMVGISAGALVAYDYYSHYGGKGEIKKLFLVGAPFQGTPLAYLVAFTKTGRSMIPNSGYLSYIHSKTVELDNVVSINAKYDEIVPNAGLIGSRIETIDIFGHAHLCAFNKEVYNLVLNLCRGSTPRF